MRENVLVGSLGECIGESWAVSLTGNEGAARGWMKDDMVGSRCAGNAALKGDGMDVPGGGSGFIRRLLIRVSLLLGEQED